MAVHGGDNSGSDTERSPEEQRPQQKEEHKEQLQASAIAELLAALRKAPSRTQEVSPNSSSKRKANEGIDFVLGDMLRSGEFDTSDSRFNFVPMKKQMTEQFLQRDIAAK